MSNGLSRLKALNEKLDKKINSKQNLFDDEFIADNTISTSVNIPKAVLSHDIKPRSIEDRTLNMESLRRLFLELKINEKCHDFDDIFLYKAMNLAGIGLKDDDFGEVRAGKYIQIIAISYDAIGEEKKKAKNISLGYYGKGEMLDMEKKYKIIEFILRWRYEKGLQSLDNYIHLLGKLKTLSASPN
ncbi:MAG: hypothetical protein IE880_08880 [Epsilonproteobacteria bacterium]|nr:hypothetical protein [Campylobacterota bacterium]